MLAALLLDLDGTLLDSEPLHMEAHRRFLASVGIAIGDEELLANIGKGDRELYARLIARHGRDADPRDWIAAKTRLLVELAQAQGVPTRRGARELLARARARGIPCCLVTSAQAWVAAALLASAGLERLLPQRVCREDVWRSKPHPDAYLLACQRLGAPPARCLAIEDSVPGVLAAQRAGCRTLAVASAQVAPEALRAAGALEVLADLCEALAA
ncbi:MAG: HAD family phosphatase [Planctomycetota bacterium]|nr:HAD family phosphatase [Planctomycetota bacterium]MCX8040857.1 HAD family phosphatase [Planctomycetota bacterium]MDW8372347.1 HAD family phosphatase [Planctomycetota bacterium]